MYICIYTQYTYICIYIYTICVYMYAIPMKDRKDITRPVNVAEHACNQCSIFSTVQ